MAQRIGHSVYSWTVTRALCDWDSRGYGTFSRCSSAAARGVAVRCQCVEGTLRLAPMVSISRTTLLVIPSLVVLGCDDDDSRGSAPGADSDAGGSMTRSDAASEGVDAASSDDTSTGGGGRASEDASMSDLDAGAPLGPTYYADVAPLIQRECLGCHSPGGIGPIQLDSFSSVRASGAIVAAAVASGRMPPWPADEQCIDYEDALGLSDEERAIFTEWVDTGMLEGEPSDLPAFEPAPQFQATHAAYMTEPYTPDDTRPDDYRCFVLDLEFAEDAFVKGRRVVPDVTELVHHVLVYAAQPQIVDQVLAADAAAEGPGYTCFGGPLPDADRQLDSSQDTSAISLIALGGWVPGQNPSILRDGRATHIPAGSRLIMQVHYNLLEDEPVPDESFVELMLSDEEPEVQVVATPIAVLDLDLPAGEPEVVEQRVLRNFRSEPMRIVGVTPHMHLLGTQISAERVDVIGGEAPDQCIVDVPDWDFNWQRYYVIEEEQTVVVQPGEGIRLSCTYDNSPSHQPVVNGVQQEPRDVRWGEGTLDEMCLVYLSEEVPWEGPPKVGCEAAEDCLNGCNEDEATCLLECEGLDGACRACLLESTVVCATDACLLPFLPAANCLRECALGYILLGGSYEDCVRAECPAAADVAFDCLGEVIGGGECVEEIADCGIPISIDAESGEAGTREPVEAGARDTADAGPPSRPDAAAASAN